MAFFFSSAPQSHVQDRAQTRERVKRLRSEATVFKERPRSISTRLREAVVHYVLHKVRFWIVAVTFAAVALAVLVLSLRWAEPLEIKIRDTMQRLRISKLGVRFTWDTYVKYKGQPQVSHGPERFDPNSPEWPKLWDVLIVMKDEDSYRDLDGYPFTPHEDRRVIETLSWFGARVVAYDQLLSERREKLFATGVKEIVEAIKEARQGSSRTRVVFGAKLDQVIGDEGTYMASALPLPEIQEVADWGHLNLPMDADKVIRKYDYIHRVDGTRTEYSFAFAAFLAALAGSSKDPNMPLAQIHEAAIIRPLQTNTFIAPFLISDEPKRRNLNFYGEAARSFPRLSYVDVYRAWVFRRVSQMATDMAAVQESLESDDLREAWKGLQGKFGEMPTLDKLDLERLAKLPAELGAALAELPADQQNGPYGVALGNCQFLIEGVLATLEPYQANVNAARVELLAERERITKAMQGRQRSIIDTIPADMRRMPALAPLLGTEHELGETLTAEAIRAIMPLVERAKSTRLRADQVAVLQWLAADLAALNRIDRQLTRISKFPVPSDPEENRLRDIIQGKVALVGPWTLDSQDQWATPFEDKFYGVELHATAVQNLFDMLNRNQDAQQQRGVVDPLVDEELAEGAGVDVRGLVIAATLVACLVTIFLPSLAAAAILGFGAWLYHWHIGEYFALHWVFLPFWYPVFGAAIGFTLITITKGLTVDQERRQIESLFKNYLDKRFVEILKSDPEKIKLGGEAREITVFFSDIAGFSAISEKLSPSELVELMNEYLGSMTEIILRYDGTLDKYIGDAIVAFWNAPVDIADHAAKACWSALEQREKLADLQNIWAARGLPTVDCRIGLNTGKIVHGNMGSNLKKNYTVMGDEVNLAARFEPLNKDFGTHIIIGEQTWRLAESRIEGRLLGKVQVKGRHAPVQFYELLARKGEIGEAQRELIALFQDGLTKYWQGDFATALSRFEACLRIAPTDGPSQTYRGLCAQYLATPPPAAEVWTGVFVQTHK